VHGKVITNGTITGRMSHQSPNMAQIPAVYSPYGKECRALWTVNKGYKLVGVDASGLELRMLAHYMNDERIIHMKSLMEIYTEQIKLLLVWNQEIRRRLLSTHLSMEQVQKKSEVSLEVRKEMAKELKKNFLEQHQVLEAYEKKWNEWLNEDGSEDSTKEK